MTKLLKHLDPKPRLLIAILVSTVTYFLLPSLWQVSTHLIFAWDMGVICFLISIWLMMTNATPQTMHSQSQRQDSSRWIILILVVAASCTSLLAIVFMLREGKNSSEIKLTIHISLSLLTILISWMLIHTMFALHYAHLYYQKSDLEEIYFAAHSIPNRLKGLEFPGTTQPDYLDFLYFSWGIGMTCQVSDVQIVSSLFRRLALGHQVLTFFFNTVILALGINILASLI